jgi:D-psicose/D-tagatose/L-ribulose 3-epimerase
MQIGCHGLLWTSTWDAAGIEYAVRGTSEIGYDLLEVPLLDPDAFDLSAAKRILKGSGLAISGGLAQSADSDISSDDPACVAAGEAKLYRALEILTEIGGTHFVGMPYSELKRYSAPPTERGRRNSIEVLRRVAERAETFGITMALEVVNRYEASMFNTAKGALEYIDEIGHRNIKVHLDTYHMNIEESDFYNPVIQCGDRLSYVHIGESHRGYLGSGTVDFDSFFRALVAVGYDGPVTFESFSTSVVTPDIAQLLAVWRDLWTDSADLASHANSFIRGKVHAIETIKDH